jgi:hypothetical protein
MQQFSGKKNMIRNRKWSYCVCKALSVQHPSIVFDITIHFLGSVVSLLCILKS